METDGRAGAESDPKPSGVTTLSLSDAPALAMDMLVNSKPEPDRLRPRTAAASLGLAIAFVVAISTIEHRDAAANIAFYAFVTAMPLLLFGFMISVNRYDKRPEDSTDTKDVLYRVMIDSSPGFESLGETLVGAGVIAFIVHVDASGILALLVGLVAVGLIIAVVGTLVGGNATRQQQKQLAQSSSSQSTDSPNDKTGG